MSDPITTTIGELSEKEREAALLHGEMLKGGAKILLDGISTLHDVGVTMLGMLAMDAPIVRKMLLGANRSQAMVDLDSRDTIQHSIIQLALSTLARLLHSNPLFGTPMLQDQIDNAMKAAMDAAFSKASSLVIQRDPPPTGRMIEFNADKAQAFTKRFEKAVLNGDEQFEFEGNVFVTGYAKYVVEHLGNVYKLA